MIRVEKIKVKTIMTARRDRYKGRPIRAKILGFFDLNFFGMTRKDMKGQVYAYSMSWMGEILGGKWGLNPPPLSPFDKGDKCQQFLSTHFRGEKVDKCCVCVKMHYY